MANISELMAAKSSDLDDVKTGATIQKEGYTITPPSSQKGPDETVASESAPSHSPSWYPARKLMPDHPETRYCLKIQVISVGLSCFMEDNP